MRKRKIKLVVPIALVSLTLAIVFQKVWYQSIDDSIMTNVEALSDGEDIAFVCNSTSPIVDCKRLCLNCFRMWIVPGHAGGFVYAIDHCVCGENLNY